MVDDGVISEGDFRDFVFTYAVDFWTGMNPDFFKGTVVENQVAALIKSGASTTDVGAARA
jgi:hypothetical protein